SRHDYPPFLRNSAKACVRQGLVRGNAHALDTASLKDSPTKVSALPRTAEYREFRYRNTEYSVGRHAVKSWPWPRPSIEPNTKCSCGACANCGSTLALPR